MDHPPLILKRNEERRLRAGHLWVFSNEVDTARTPLDGFEPGELVRILAHNGKVLGVGYVNPRSLICARLLTRGESHDFDAGMLRRRIEQALSLREVLFEEPFYRLIHGESDLLPGLVVDRYDGTLVVQLNTAGMDRMQQMVLDALEEVLLTRAILLRNDSPARELEGLDRHVVTAFGKVPETVEVQEGGLRFLAPLASGQKTGWFFDHRRNRTRLRDYAKERRVLDLFSYLGGWGLQAAAGGAHQVQCVDSSQDALELLQRNAALNGLESKVETLQGDAFDVLKELRAGGAKFDLVVLDPPAFIKRRKDYKSGLEAYRRLNQMALQVLEDEGILVTASCSWHLQEKDLTDLLRRSALYLNRDLQLLEPGSQGPDHPVHPAIPETRYLKCWFCRSSMMPD
ncbi:MAG: class I SAM-dependent rRNA methyltransferase [Gammaproteobacteria bacterium]|nr:MAG: class I SAM-dependent rRNA methyltransferase [Gammaproteobacteria bacterium]